MFISEAILSNIIQAGLSEGADFCEIYVEERLSSFMQVKSSCTEYMSGKDRGVGIRLFYGNQELYTYTSSFEEKDLLQSLKNLTLSKKHLKTLNLNQEPFVFSFKQKYPQEFKPSLDKEKAFLQKANKELRSSSSLISQAVLSFQRSLKSVQIANSEGLSACDVRPYFNFSVSAIAEDQGEKEMGYQRLGHTKPSWSLDEDLFLKAVKRSGKIALRNLTAEHAPAGQFPVIINKGFGGVIFHEACGHGMETTSVAEKFSVFSDKLGQRVAKNCVTAYDDGLLEGEYGSLSIDDEGQTTQKTCLIEKGILKNYMVDKLGSQKTSYKMTGSARRESYKYPPTSRMRNTYIAPGAFSLEEMIKDVDYGIFAETLGGGSVSPGTGAYNFAVASARLIQKGRLGPAVKGASLIGNGLESLSKIEKVGKDLELSPGHCGSISGWVPVTVGQPPLLLSSLTVGGQA